MLTLSNLKPAPGSKHRRKRLGCGESSGHGKTSGRGSNGQKSRSGSSTRLGFEGGQMPLIRRLPKRGFTNAKFKDKVAIINLSSLNCFEDGTVISEQTLREAKLIKGVCDFVKILGNGDLERKLTVEIPKVSAAAKAKIEAAGGTIKLIDPKKRYINS